MIEAEVTIVIPHKVPLMLKLIGMMKLLFATLLAATALGAFRLIDRDIGETMETFVKMLHLDPKKHIINEALSKVSGLDHKELKQIGAATLVYSLLYLIEGIGLLRGKHWAEYMVIIITSSLLPLEAYEIIQQLDMVRIGVMLLNLCTVGYLIYRLRRDYLRKKRLMELNLA